MKDLIRISIITIVIAATFFATPSYVISKQLENERFVIYSDSRISATKIDSTLQLVLQELMLEGINPEKFCIYSCANHSMYSVYSYYFDRKSLANTHAISNRIYLAPLDSASENVVSVTGRRRALHEVIKHELVHIYFADTYGIKSFAIPRWKEEGVCEFLSVKATDTATEYKAKFIEHKVIKSAYNEEYSLILYKYFVYRMRVDYLFRIKGVKLSELIDLTYDTEKLDEEIRVAIRHSRYDIN